jgi:glycerol-3-phosphate O-acyltransferase
MLDDIAEAVLAREEVVKYLRHDPTRAAGARERIHEYLDELRTTQRYPIYRALQHPLYPILRKVERRPEQIQHVQAAVTAGQRLVYASNHKSHIDYLVEPLALDDNGVRPPLIAAGANLFGGPLGLIHRHVTGAIPIRRNTKDPAYLVTLKAYIAEVLKKHDLFFYPEGGRSYSGELKPLKTGLVNAALAADHPDLVIVPTAVAYDLVLEDHILARQAQKRSQRPFTRELAEMVRFAVGYQSRAFVTFGAPVPLKGYDPESRREVLHLAQSLRETIGRLYKVLPTALVAAAMRSSTVRRDLEDRVEILAAELRAAHANLGAAPAAQVVDEGLEQLGARGVLVVERSGRIRVRERAVLRYYARTIQHLASGPRKPVRTH